MKFRFNRQEMVEVLAPICNVTSVRTPKEILKCVRIEARSDAVLLSATDLELSVRCAATEVDVDKPGEALVIAGTLNRIVRECSDEVMDVEVAQNVLHLRGAGSHFQIVLGTVADFPPVPEMEGEPDFTIDHAVLCRLMEWTAFAAARESTRYAINGVLLEVADNGLTMVATDGRRLSLAHGALVSCNTADVPNAIIPSKTLALLRGLPADADSVASVQVTANRLMFKLGGAMISSSLVEGHFPKYRDVIPTDCDRVVVLNTAEFHSALKRAALLTNEESKGVRLSFEKGGLTLSSRASEQGEATISLEVDYSGEPVEIGFNPVFLADVLRVAHSEEITFAFKEANRPGVVRLGDDFVHVVMPVNLSSS